MSALKIGDTVRYRGDFLRSIGCYSGVMGWARGTVTELKPLGADTTLATIDWANVSADEVPTKINVKNLERTRKAR
jgi:hypothetical protein